MIDAYPCDVASDEDGELVATFPASPGQELVAVPAVITAKLALHSAMRAQNITDAELARRLAVRPSVARRLTDPDSRSRIGDLQEALDAVGCQLVSDVIERVVAGWRRRIRTRAGSPTRALMGALPSMPVFDVSSVAARLEVSPRAARRAVEALEAAGIVASSGTRRNRRYRAAEMIDVLRRATPDGARSPGWPGDEPSSPAPRPVCDHVGVRSKRRCVLAYGHAGGHRYRR